MCLARLARHPQVAQAPASVSDVGSILDESCPHTNARHQFVIESQRLECSRVAAEFVGKTLHWLAKLADSMGPIPSRPLRVVAGKSGVWHALPGCVLPLLAKLRTAPFPYGSPKVLQSVMNFYLTVLQV
jgi:hypothetical protein